MMPILHSPGVGGLHDSVGRAGGRHVDDRRGGAGRAYRLVDGVEDRDALERRAAPPRGHARDHLCAVLAAEAGVELTGRAGDALGHDARVPIDEDAHDRLAAATALRAPSSMSLAVKMSRPESARIFFP